MRIDTSLKCLFITLVLYVPCWYEFSRYKSQPVPLVSMDEVNQWVENVTNGHIPNFLESIPHDVVLMLMNAVYFKGDPLHKTKLFIIVFYSQRKDGTKLNPCSLTGQINQSFLKGEKSSQNCENCKKKSVLAKEDIILKKQYHCHITRQHIVQTREASHAINEHCKDKPWYNVIIYSRFNNWEINWI